MSKDRKREMEREKEKGEETKKYKRKKGNKNTETCHRVFEIPFSKPTEKGGGE